MINTINCLNPGADKNVHVQSALVTPEILKIKMMKDIMMMDPDEFLSDQEAEGFAFDTLPIV